MDTKTRALHKAATHAGSHAGGGKILALTARIAGAYAAHNRIAGAAVPALIRDIHRSLQKVGHVGPTAAPPAPNPAMGKAKPVNIRQLIKRSVKPDYLVCLEDGRKLKILKRHLRAAYGMTPAQYRAKWGLPPDYPMVAPRYAAERSAFAKKMGLGKTGAAKRPSGPPTG